VSGTRWRVLFVAGEMPLLASIEGASKRTSELLFLAFVIVLALAIVLAVRTMGRSAELAAAREREAAALKLAHERLHDALTGLPNRALFEDRLQHALAGLPRRGTSLAVIFFDLDSFKRINDSRGHAVGDELLRTVAQRMRDVVRATDTISRFGGDEFLVLCEDVEDAQVARGLAARVQEAISQPVELDGHHVPLSVTAGIVVHGPSDRPSDAAGLVLAADTAMYRAKQRRRGSIELFDAELDREAMDRLDLELGLRDAVARDELVVHYQPIVTPADGRIQGVEALVRWNRPGHGLVPPMCFIPVAEETGLIVEIGAWILNRAASDVAAWHRAGIVEDGFTLSVNLSARQLGHASLIDDVGAALAKSGLAPSMLCLEITESVVMKDPDLALESLVRLKEVGVGLAIDDFGVGQSSLEHVARLLPVSVIKLDRSFVMAMADERDLAVVSTVASLASSLHMAAVAEGVESAEQARTVADLGYPLAQGFYFARPADAATVRARLEAGLASRRGA